MAVAVDATAAAPTIVGTATTSATLTNLTVGGSATALLAVVNANNNLASLALTWDNGGTNQAMTLVGSANITSGFVWIYGLVNPTPGAKTLRAAWTGSLTCILDALSFTGTAADTVANAFKNFNSATPAASTSPPITLTGASGNISFCTSANNTNSYTSPYLNATGSTNLYHDATHVAGTSAYAPSASSVAWTAHTSSSLAAVLAGVDVSVPSGAIISWNVAAPSEYQGSLRLTGVTANEWVGSPRLNSVLANERLTTDKLTTLAPIERSGQLQPNATIPVERSGQLRIAGASLAERSLFAYSESNIASERLVRSAVGNTSPAEALGHLLVTAGGKIGPITPYHFAPNANWPNNFDPQLQNLGFNLADVPSAALLPFLPSGVKALVFVGNPNGVDTSFTTLMSACAPYINSIFAFYLADTADPDPAGTWGTFYDPANLKAQADYIHTNFPGSKTFIWLANLGTNYAPAYDQYNGFTGYLPSNTDIDYYGISGYAVRDDLNNGYDPSIIGLNYNAALAAGIPGDVIVPSYQAFGLGTWGAPYEIPTPAQLRGILAAWALVTPRPPFDYCFAWGPQNSDVSLNSLPDLQAVARENNLGQAIIPAGSLTVTRSNEAVSTESLYLESRREVVPAEWLGTPSVNVSYDALSPIEWQSAVQIEDSHPLSFMGSERIGWLASSDRIGSVRPVGVSLIEAAVTAKPRWSAPNATVSYVDRSSVVRVEWAGASVVSVSYDSLMSLEWLSKAAWQASPPFSFTGIEKSDWLISSERAGIARSDEKVPTARHANIDSDESTSAEWLGTPTFAVSYDSRASLEWLSKTALADRVTAGRLAEVSQEIASAIEVLGVSTPVHYDAVAPIEWLKAASLSAESKVEFSLSVYEDQPVSLDWTTPSFVPPPPSNAGYVWVEADRVDIRRYCGYPPYGTGAVIFPEPWVFRYYLALEARLSNLTATEADAVKVFLTNLRVLEVSIPASSSNLDTNRAAVWVHNKSEVADRSALYHTWRVELCATLGIPQGPYLKNEVIPVGHNSGNQKKKPKRPSLPTTRRGRRK